MLFILNADDLCGLEGFWIIYLEYDFVLLLFEFKWSTDY